MGFLLHIRAMVAQACSSWNWEWKRLTQISADGQN